MMRKGQLLLMIAAASMVFGGCQRSSQEVWEDTRTCSRYMGRGVGSLAGKNGDSRQVRSRQEFGLSDNNTFQQYREPAYIPLEDEDAYASLSLNDREVIPPSQLTPGQQNGPVPGIERFKDPAKDPNLSHIFSNVRFAYNSSLVRGERNLNVMKRIGSYMKDNPNTYVFIEGHCDERGPQAYNLALGTRRANAVRTMLTQEGVNPDRLFTVSYGKERPLALGHDEESHSANRRSQFRLYTR